MAESNITDKHRNLDETQLTSKQREVIDRLTQTQRTLERWPGGYWTDEQIPVDYLRGRRPSWYCGSQTVFALERAGLLTSVNQAGAWSRPRFRLTNVKID